eukprot:9106078-Alexandrium_andersonii.AAC.1
MCIRDSLSLHLFLSLSHGLVDSCYNCLGLLPPSSCCRVRVGGREQGTSTSTSMSTSKNKSQREQKSERERESKSANLL